MGRTVSELKKAMSLEEFASWVAFDNIRPIGGDRNDLLLAQIHTTIRAFCGIKNAEIYDSAWWLDTRTEEQKAAAKLEEMKQSLNFLAVQQKAKVEKNVNNSKH